MGSGFGDAIKWIKTDEISKRKSVQFFNPNDDDDITIPYYKPLISEKEAKEIFGDAIKYPPKYKDPWEIYPTTNKICLHEWVDYEGLFEVFKHCRLCGKKKDA